MPGGDQLVAGEPAPGRQILGHRGLRRADLEELARVQRVNPATDLEQQTAAAIQIAAIKPDGRLEGMKSRRV